MTKARKMSRVLSWIMAMVFVISLLPVSVFAELGALEVPGDGISYVTTMLNSETALHAESTPKGIYHVLFNDYITFILRPNGAISTIPTRSLPYMFYTVMQESELFKTHPQMNKYMRDIPVTEKVTFYGAKGSHSIGFDYESGNAVSTAKLGNNKLLAVYKIDTGEGNKNPVITVTYEIVRVDKGTTDGRATGEVVQADSSDTGRHWGVRATAEVSYEGSKLIHTDSYNDIYKQANFTMVTDHIDFAKNREDKSQGAIQYSTNDYQYISYGDAYDQNASSFWNSATEMPITSVETPNGGTITEFYTSSFGTANQFVAMGSSYVGSWQGGTNQLSGVAGHAASSSDGGNYGKNISYGNEAYIDFNGSAYYETKALRVYSQTALWDDYRDDADAMNALWGYRDLYKMDGETDIPENENNYVEVSQGGYLGIGKANGEAYAISGKSIDALKKTHGDRLIAVFRGAYTKSYEDNGELYVFTDNVALSPTVTATKRDASSSFTVSSDGTVTMNNMGISCPAFQFYTPKNGMGITFDFSGSKSGVLNMVIDPAKNDSILHLDIPGATSIMDGVSIGIDGQLTFKGTMSISTPVLDIADVTVNQIAMGYKGDTYTVNGIEASGGVSMDELLGMPSNSVYAYINTFENTEKYEFKLNIEVPSLFETEAELTLVRLDNGAIAPDNLRLFVGGNTGFPLVAPVVVAEITGAGGGFSNLADTVNGDFFAVPPLKLSLTGQAEVLQMLSGKATMTVGLGYYEKKLHDPEFFNLFGLDAEYAESTYFTGDKRSFRGTTFTGVAVGGSKRLEVHLPSETTNIINVDSGLSVDAFAGVAKIGNNTFVMLDLNGDGKIDGSLKFPKQVGGLALPKKIANQTIASTTFELALGLKTVFNLNKDIEDIVWDGVKNASGNATISYSQKFLGSKLYVAAIFAKKNIKIGLDTWFGDINASFNWGSANKAKLMSYGETDDMYYAMYLTSDIESLGSTNEMRLMSVNMDDELVSQLEAAGITITQNGEDENNYTVTLSNTAKTEQLLFTFTPQTAADDNTLESMFTIKKDENDYTLTFDDYDDEGESTVDGANAYVSAGGEDETSGETVNAGVVAQLLGAGTYTISANDAFDIEVLGFELAEYIDTDGAVKELKDGRTYVVRSYLMDADGEYHFVGEEAEATNDYIVTSAEISATQDSVPSGTYKKVYRLLEKVIAEESGEYYVTLDTFESGEITVTNPNDVPKPTNVTAASVGSEILRASWNAPADNTNVNGYAVTIYQQGDGGEWINTSTGYEVRADEGGSIPTTIDMALTIGGDGDTDGDGTRDVENAALEADETYRISVAALSDMTADLNNDGNDETVAKRSEEVFSAAEGVYIPEATPPELIYSPEPVTAKDSNMKIMYVESGGKFNVRSEVGAVITVTRTDTNEQIGSDTQNVDVTVPDFEGSIIIQIDATGTDGDRARDYIALRKDEIAPVITFDSDSFTADENGNFTITGVTEPAVEFTLNTKDIKTTEETYEPCYDITQNTDGSFTITGELAEHTKSMDDSIGGALIFMNVTDKAGNISDDVFANVIYGAAADDSGTTTRPSSGGGVTRYTIKFETNGGTEIASKTVTRNSLLAEPEAPTKDGYTFMGWYTDEELTEKYDFDSKIAKDFTLYAKWEKHDDETSAAVRWNNPFEDVSENDWFFEDVKYANINELMNGVSETEFAPNNKLTRAMLVTVLWRMENEPAVDYLMTFEDVSADTWYTEAVRWANSVGVVKGYSAESFGPEDDITREQIAAIMFRYAQYKEIAPTGAWAIRLTYTDLAEISDYAAEGVMYCKLKEIMQGKGENLFAPKDNATRAEIAAILHRFIEVNK